LAFDVESAVMGLQLFVRHSADVAIIDVHGKATIGLPMIFYETNYDG